MHSPKFQEGTSVVGVWALDAAGHWLQLRWVPFQKKFLDIPRHCHSISILIAAWGALSKQTSTGSDWVCVESAPILVWNLCGACNWQKQTRRVNRLSTRNIAWSFEVCTAHTCFSVFLQGQIGGMWKNRDKRSKNAERVCRKVRTSKKDIKCHRCRILRQRSGNLRCWPSRGSREKTPVPSIWRHDHSDFFDLVTEISTDLYGSQWLGMTRSDSTQIISFWDQASTAIAQTCARWNMFLKLLNTSN